MRETFLATFLEPFLATLRTLLREPLRETFLEPLRETLRTLLREPFRVDDGFLPDLTAARV